MVPIVMVSLLLNRISTNSVSQIFSFIMVRSSRMQNDKFLSVGYKELPHHPHCLFCYSVIELNSPVWFGFSQVSFIDIM